jgi:predicted ABC-type ATPase
MSKARKPNVIVIAGPNGAGKSTTAPIVLRDTLGITEFVNADQIASGLSAFNPEGAAFEAGRIMLQRLNELSEQQMDFAFETTLASRSFAPFIRKLKEQHNYSFKLLFFWLKSRELAQQRVAHRVASGGHDIPPETIARRYTRGLDNFFQLYRPIADTWRLYDNSRTYSPKLIAHGKLSKTSRISDKLIWTSLRDRHENR